MDVSVAEVDFEIEIHNRSGGAVVCPTETKAGEIVEKYLQFFVSAPPCVLLFNSEAIRKGGVTDNAGHVIDKSGCLQGGHCDGGR